MRLRTQLALAFFLLAVLPLGAIALFSYTRSIQAFRRAVEAESLALAGEMETRLAATRASLRSRMQMLGEMAAAPAAEEAGAAPELAAIDERELRRLAATLGESLPFVESLEFIPLAPAAPAQPLQPEAPAEGVVVFLDPPPPTPPVPAVPAEPPAPPAAPAPGAPPGVRPSAAEQRRAAEEMERVGREMARLAGQIAGHGLEREVREKLHREIEVQRRAALRQARETTRSLLGGELGATVERRDRVIGRLQPQVRARAVLDDVLAAARRDQGEIPFAIDAEGRLHAASDADAERLRGLPLGQQGAAPPATLANWVVVTKEDAASGLRFGIARPVRASLREIRRTAVLNFVYGVALAALCFLGIFPLSARITRNLEALTAGAEKLAQGDLETRVPIRSRDEFGRLAHTFNRMAEQLGLHRRQLVEEARRREEQEVERALLAAESQRKSDELERARAFQLSLLPREVPRHPGFALEVRTATAAEVGGDYYDFLPGGDGELTLAIGDATGHGAASGTMVAVVKGLFHARAGEASPAAFLSHANEVVRRLQLGRMAMAMTVVRLRGSRLRLAAAGMPPALVYRAASGEVEELVLHAPPLGALGEGAYGEVETDLGPGDAALLMTDGFPESLDETGEPLGYPRAQELFAASAAKPPAELLADLERAVDAWRGTRPLADDVTFVALRRSV